MTNAANQPQLKLMPQFILMAVRDVNDAEEIEAVLAFEEQPKKLLEAIGCNDLEGVQAAYEKLAEKHFECDFVLMSPQVNTSIHLAMQLSTNGTITHEDVFKNLNVDRLLSWPANHHPSSYIGAVRYLTDKAEKSPKDMTIIEQMAMVSAALSGLGGSFKAQPAEMQGTYRKSAHYYVNQLTAEGTKYVHDDGIRHLVNGILNLFEPCDAPGPVIPPEFTKAMNNYVAIRDAKGDDSDEAARAFINAMRLAPDWFSDMATDKAKEMGLIPESPHGYTEDGTPLYSIEQLAEVLGVPVESVHEKVQKMIDENDGDLPQGILVDAGKIHRRQ